MTGSENTAAAIIISVITALLADNFVFGRAFGVSTMMIAARNKRYLPGVCLGVCYFTLAGSAAGRTLALNEYLELSKPYLPLVYAAVIGLVYAVTLVGAFLIFRSRFARIKKYVHISAFNSAVMGTIFLSANGAATGGSFVLFGLCAGAGFTGAAYMLSGVYPKLCSENVPAAFRGYPAIMIFTGIIAMAVYGILGRVPMYM